MNILTRMATNSAIKQVFGNHDMTRQYLDYLTSPELTIPPFRPVLYRSIAIGGVNDDDAINANARSYHEAKNRQVMRQLINQYIIYLQLQQGELQQGELQQ
jgi:hypothetical protein